MIAGIVSVQDVMERLAERRPASHSEADFQFAFAQQVAELAPGIRIRPEFKYPAAR